MDAGVGRAPRADGSFFDRPVLQVAPALLGAVLTSTIAGELVVVRLTEVEAYDGALDPGSHAYRGRTPRNATMFGPPGLIYVYFTYGMHFCANVVCGPQGSAHAVLLRGGEVVDGLAAARTRRYGANELTDERSPGTSRTGGARDRRLASGPANLAKAVGLTTLHNGIDITAGDSCVWIEPPLSPPQAGMVQTGPRVGVGGPGGDAHTFPWRFWLGGEASVSTYRPAVTRVRRPRTR